MTNILDASPKKKGFTVPTEPVARNKFYLDLMEKYQAKNPVKFESKREELKKKADGYIYTYNPKTNRTEWMLVYPIGGTPLVLEETKKTPIEKEEEQRQAEEEAKIEAKVQERLAAIEGKPTEPEPVKTKGRPKKIK